MQNEQDLTHSHLFSLPSPASSRIVFCTEGILLRELVGDPTLAAYDCVVLDEVRHLWATWRVCIKNRSSRTRRASAARPHLLRGSRALGWPLRW